MNMKDRARTVVVVVRPGTNPRRSAVLLRWLRWLLPTALLIVSNASVALPQGEDDVITLDADAIESGPLSVASAIEKALSRS
jgi:hypothetical protein